MLVSRQTGIRKQKDLAFFKWIHDAADSSSSSIKDQAFQHFLIQLCTLVLFCLLCIFVLYLFQHLVTGGGMRKTAHHCDF